MSACSIDRAYDTMDTTIEQLLSCQFSSHNSAATPQPLNSPSPQLPTPQLPIAAVVVVVECAVGAIVSTLVISQRVGGFR